MPKVYVASGKKLQKWLEKASGRSALAGQKKNVSPDTRRMKEWMSVIKNEGFEQ